MAAHDEAASRAFPGPDFHQVLKWIHEAVKPATYVEIGVHSGGSLAAVRRQTVAVGIDPEPCENFLVPANIRIFPLTSSEFFARYDLGQVLGGRAVDFALIDGLHLFEQALEDLCNLERFMAAAGTIAVHDTIPLNGETSARVRTTEFYTGDVWKLVPYLRQHRPELEMATVTAAPTGLTLIRGLDPLYDHASLPGSTAGFRALEYDHFARHREEFLRTIPNHRDAVEAFCQKTPVQSMVSSGVVMRSR